VSRADLGFRVARPKTRKSRLLECHYTVEKLSTLHRKEHAMTDTPMLDLGAGRVVPKGASVTATNISGEKITGTLFTVEMRRGEPFTATIATSHGMRSTYVDRVSVKGAK